MNPLRRSFLIIKNIFRPKSERPAPINKMNIFAFINKTHVLQFNT
jgi:hypothetical protein